MEWLKIAKSIWKKGNIIIQVSYGDLSKVWFLDYAEEIIPYEKYNNIIPEESYKTKKEALRRVKEIMEVL